MLLHDVQADVTQLNCKTANSKAKDADWEGKPTTSQG